MIQLDLKFNINSSNLDRTYFFESGITCSVTDVKNVVHNLIGLESNSYYLVSNGKILVEKSEINDGSKIDVIPRILGGKGGFGSMLRAIGAQIEKTTNRDACRDLSGRRLRDINEEQRLKRWFAKQKQRDQQKAELKKKKLEKLRQICEGSSLPKTEDQQYNKIRSEMAETIFEAVEKGFEAASETTNKSSVDNDQHADNQAASSSSKSSSDESPDSNHEEIPSSSIAVINNETKKKEQVPQKFKRTLFDEDLDSDVSSSDSESEDEIPAKRAKK